MDWFRTVGIGIFSVILFWFISVPDQFAYADIIFADSFVKDPEEDGRWVETMVQVPSRGVPSTAIGDITSDGNDAVLFKMSGAGGLELSITKSIDISEFGRVQK